VDASAKNPFREDDLPARVQALRDERSALAQELARVRSQTVALTPWSTKRFLFGLVLLPVSVGMVVLAVVARV
jgi:hypothetical protein